MPTTPFATRLQRAAAYIVVLAVAAYLYEVASHFAYEPVAGRIGPDAWPKIVLVLLMATCVWKSGRILLFGVPDPSLEELEEDAPIVPEQGGTFVYLAWTGIAITVAYAYFMPILGFFAATVLFIAAVSAIAGRYRKPLPLALTSIIAPLVLMFVFMRIVYIALPLGRGSFKELSLVLLKVLGIH